jgi:hypothetical protein
MATTLYVYLGDGSSNPSNVPARDLTDEDWEAFDPLQKESVIRHSDPDLTAAAAHLYEGNEPAPQQDHQSGGRKRNG